MDRLEEMLGSYAPGKTNEKKFPLEEAPSGMLARGKYEARSKFIDDDGHSYLDFAWSFEVTFLKLRSCYGRSRKVGIEPRHIPTMHWIISFGQIG